MIGLEKMKAKAGEISHSARALTLEDMHRLHAYCLREDQSAAEKRWGVIRYVSAFVVLVREVYDQLNDGTECLSACISDDASHRRGPQVDV